MIYFKENNIYIKKDMVITFCGKFLDRHYGEFLFLTTFYQRGSLTFLRFFLSFYGVGFFKSEKFVFLFFTNIMNLVYKFDKKMHHKLTRFFKYLLVGEQFLILKKNEFRKKLLVKTYQRLRFKLRLPMRGQRTHSNAGSIFRFRFPVSV